jgi:aminopeptidase N
LLLERIPFSFAKASSLTFYQKGMGTFVLHEIGDKAFKKAVSNYLKKHAFQNVNTEDFFVEIKNIEL